MEEETESTAPVLVDTPLHHYRGMIMCHMLSKNLEKLHQMADRIGVSRRWFQEKGTPHYDICKTKRALALKLGAVEATKKEVVQIIKHFRKKRTPPASTKSEPTHKPYPRMA